MAWGVILSPFQGAVGFSPNDPRASARWPQPWAKLSRPHRPKRMAAQRNIPRPERAPEPLIPNVPFIKFDFIPPQKRP